MSRSSLYYITRRSNFFSKFCTMLDFSVSVSHESLLRTSGTFNDVFNSTPRDRSWDVAFYKDKIQTNCD